MLLKCTCKNTMESRKRTAKKQSSKLREHRATKDGAWECTTCGRRKAGRGQRAEVA